MADPNLAPLSAAELALFIAGQLASPRTRDVDVLAATIRAMAAGIDVARECIGALTAALAEAERVKAALTNQLVRAERRAGEPRDE